jgi:hypothetical protein
MLKEGINEYIFIYNYLFALSKGVICIMRKMRIILITNIVYIVIAQNAL